MADRAGSSSARTYRRRTRFRPTPERVFADVEDYQHRFALALSHADGRIAAIEGQTIRAPWVTCPGALVVLDQLIGVTLDPSPFAIMGQFNLAQQCTHLADLACLSGAGVARGEEARIYDVVISVTPWGEHDTRRCRVWRNGELLYNWSLVDGVVADPGPFEGQLLYRAPRWAPQRENDPAVLEALFVAMRTFMVSNGLRYDDPDAFDHAANSKVGRNACFAMQEARIAGASRASGQIRNFSGQDQLLAD